MSFWDTRYSQDGYIFGEAPNRFVAANADRLRGYRNALAVADGEGRNGVFLAEQGLDVLSIDASPVGLAKAEKLARNRGVSLTTQCGDIGAYDWPEAAFDVVAAIFIQFAPPAMRDAMFAGMVQTLKPGGILLLEGYRPEQLGYGTGGPSQLENLYTEELLRDRFAALEIISLESYDAELSEGTAHAGPSALIDLVARKPE
ncbi:class I SAM-dependent methyltransferase [Devosia aquimaris]|uniref:class I SAM-dependent methyltransferase n=1 Tax=Devosia aquimaris TaxID=2866214 RepID=UPI001CD08567|nr:class I SAM-dependent methyltransferase [Devosia sp. CJK-A8-3]